MSDGLSLGYLTLPGATAFDLVHACVAAGVSKAGIRVAGRLPSDSGPWVAHDLQRSRELKSLLDDTGISIVDVAAYYIGPGTNADDFERVLDTTAYLGAGIVCTSGYHTDERLMSALIHALATSASQRGLSIALEFVPYSEVRTLDAALRILDMANVPNAGVVFDMMHFMRSGGQIRDLGAIPQARLSLVQICDGAKDAPTRDKLAEEARGNRLFPGEGAFPIREILDAIPQGADLEIEIPHASGPARSFAEQASLCVQKVRAFLDVTNHKGNK